MFDNLKYIFLPGHDERYAHIPPAQRHEYPDEIFDKDLNVTIVRRIFTRSELRETEPWQALGNRLRQGEVVRTLGDLIFAKDVSLSAAAEHKRQFDEERERNRPHIQAMLKRDRETAEWWQNYYAKRFAEKNRQKTAAEAARRQIAE
jgi:hypothetical protein